MNRFDYTYYRKKYDLDIKDKKSLQKHYEKVGRNKGYFPSRRMEEFHIGSLNFNPIYYRRKYNLDGSNDKMKKHWQDIGFKKNYYPNKCTEDDEHDAFMCVCVIKKGQMKSMYNVRGNRRKTNVILETDNNNYEFTEENTKNNKYQKTKKANTKKVDKTVVSKDTIKNDEKSKKSGFMFTFDMSKINSKTESKSTLTTANNTNNNEVNNVNNEVNNDVNNEIYNTVYNTAHNTEIQDDIDSLDGSLDSSDNDNDNNNNNVNNNIFRRGTPITKIVTKKKNNTKKTVTKKIINNKKAKRHMTASELFDSSSDFTEESEIARMRRDTNRITYVKNNNPESQDGSSINIINEIDGINNNSISSRSVHVKSISSKCSRISRTGRKADRKINHKIDPKVNPKLNPKSNAKINTNKPVNTVKSVDKSISNNRRNRMKMDTVNSGKTKTKSDKLDDVINNIYKYKQNKTFTNNRYSKSKNVDRIDNNIIGKTIGRSNKNKDNVKMIREIDDLSIGYVEDSQSNEFNSYPYDYTECSCSECQRALQESIESEYDNDNSVIFIENNDDSNDIINKEDSIEYITYDGLQSLTDEQINDSIDRVIFNIEYVREYLDVTNRYIDQLLSYLRDIFIVFTTICSNNNRIKYVADKNRVRTYVIEMGRIVSNAKYDDLPIFKNDMVSVIKFPILDMYDEDILEAVNRIINEKEFFTMELPNMSLDVLKIHNYTKRLINENEVVGPDTNPFPYGILKKTEKRKRPDYIFYHVNKFEKVYNRIVIIKEALIDCSKTLYHRIEHVESFRKL